MKINIPLKGKDILNRLFQYFDLTWKWNLSNKDLLILVELYYLNYTLTLDGVKDEEVRCQTIFSKRNKEKIAKDTESSVAVINNTLVKFRKLGLVIDGNKLSNKFNKIDIGKEGLELIITLMGRKNNEEEFTGKSELDSKKVLERHSRLYGTTYYMQKEAEEIVDDLAKEFKMSKPDIKDIVLMQFKVFRDILDEANPKSKDIPVDLNKTKIIRMMHFGMFCPINEIRNNNKNIFNNDKNNRNDKF